MGTGAVSFIPKPSTTFLPSWQQTSPFGANISSVLPSGRNCSSLLSLSTPCAFPRLSASSCRSCVCVFSAISSRMLTVNAVISFLNRCLWARCQTNRHAHLACNGCPCLKYVKERGERWGHFHHLQPAFRPIFTLLCSFLCRSNPFLITFFQKLFFFSSRRDYFLPLPEIEWQECRLSASFHQQLSIDYLLNAPRPTDSPNIPIDDRFLRQSPV